MAKIIYNQRSLSDIDLVVPECHWEKWHDRNIVNLPDPNVKVEPLDRYQRFVWTRIEGATQGSYNWAWFDGLVDDCWSKKQKLHIGIMTVYHDGAQTVLDAGGVQYDGGVSAYPAYLHTLMQGEAVKDWRLSGGGATSWIPNGNSPSYHARLLALHQAIVSRLTTRGRIKVLGRIDIRGWGNWGEIHSGYYDGFVVSQYPANTFPTVASFKAIIDAHKNGFPNNQLQAMLSWFDANYFNNTRIPPEIAEYILDQSNNVGPYGIRRDNIGATDQYMKDYFETNTRFFEPGNPFGPRMLLRYQTSPITAEAPGWNPGDYFDLERQVRLQHTVSFGNGNFGDGENLNSTAQARIRSAAKAAGFRLHVLDGEVTHNPTTDQITVKMNWQNDGITPPYEHWDVIIELYTNAGAVVKTHTSTKAIRLFLPSTSPSPHTDTFTSGVAAGTYNVRWYVKHREAYRDNMPIYITGADSLGRYSLGTIQILASAPVPNPGPVVNAGGNIVITLPTNTVTLIGSATDDESIVDKSWSRFSGDAGAIIDSPGEYNTLVRNLKAGTYTFRLTATDNEDATNFDDVQVVVNPAPIVNPPTTPPATTPIVKQVELFAKVTMSTGSSQTVQVSAPDPTTFSPTSASTSGTTTPQT